MKKIIFGIGLLTLIGLAGIRMVSAGHSNCCVPASACCNVDAECCK